MRKVMVLMLLCLLAGCVLCCGAQAEKVSGTWGTCPWEIENGVLTVHAGTGESIGTGASISPPWYEYAGSIRAVVMKEKVVFPPVVMRLFQNFKECKAMDLSGVVTDQVTDMYYLFGGCSQLESLDLSSFRTGNVETMSSMFSYDYSLKTIDLSSFSTKKVKNMSYMFDSCDALTSLDLSNFTIGSETSTLRMVASCTSLKSVQLPSTVKALGESCFDYCTSLRQITIPASVTEIGPRCFAQCSPMICWIQGKNTVFAADSFVTGTPGNARPLLVGLPGSRAAELAGEYGVHFAVQDLHPSFTDRMSADPANPIQAARTIYLSLENKEGIVFSECYTSSDWSQVKEEGTIGFYGSCGSTLSYLFVAQNDDGTEHCTPMYYIHFGEDSLVSPTVISPEAFTHGEDDFYAYVPTILPQDIHLKWQESKDAVYKIEMFGGENGIVFTHWQMDGITEPEYTVPADAFKLGTVNWFWITAYSRDNEELQMKVVTNKVMVEGAAGLKGELHITRPGIRYYWLNTMSSADDGVPIFIPENSKELTIAWTPVENAAFYRVVLYQDLDGNSMMDFFKEETQECTLSVPMETIADCHKYSGFEGVYMIWVYAYDAYGNYDHEVRYFRLGDPAAMGMKVNRIAVSGEAEGFLNVTENTAVLTWNAVPGADRYCYRVMCDDEGMSHGVLETIDANNKREVTISLKSGARYVAGLQAMKGNEVINGGWAMIDANSGFSLEAPEISSPREGVVPASALPVVWKKNAAAESYDVTLKKYVKSRYGFNLSQVFSEKGVTGNRYTIPADWITPASRYEITVTANYDGGITKSTSVEVTTDGDADSLPAVWGMNMSRDPQAPGGNQVPADLTVTWPDAYAAEYVAYLYQADEDGKAGELLASFTSGEPSISIPARSVPLGTRIMLRLIAADNRYFETAHSLYFRTPAPKAVLRLPASVIRVNSGAFAGIQGCLVYVPASVTVIENGAFEPGTILVLENESLSSRAEKLGLFWYVDPAAFGDAN